jgi:helicase
MEIISLKGMLPFEIIDSITSRGIVSLTPPQEQAVEKGLLKGKSIVVASPTASGKTLVAEIACANAVIANRRKAVYVAPMRALVGEKFNEFKHAYPYIKTAMSIGDLDSSDSWLRSCDVLFVSTEKFDSLMRHGIDWLPQVGCIVFDEIHMVGDYSRGPTLEILITRLKSNTDAQIIALSATIGNAKDIAKWINAELVSSYYRPVKLKKGIVNDGIAYCADPDSLKDIVEERLEGRATIPEVRIVEDTIARGKQALIFYSTKRNAEAGAARLAPHVEGCFSAEERKKLDALAEKVRNILERPTEQCIKLSDLIRKGVAFHHAGLINAQKNLVEEAFKAGSLKAVCSTTTLALGINMPAHTVLVRDITRFDSGISEMMGVNEVTQIFGRAGRPKYDTEGRAFLLAATKERVSELFRSYITASPEPVFSSLGVIPVLRSHVLAFIAENFLTDKAAMQSFLLKTFYGFQYGNTRHIKNLLDEIIDELIDFEFIKKEDEGFLATKIGKRVSELYIDPISAKWLINSLERKNDINGLLFMLTNTIEMRPYVKATLEAEEEFAAHNILYRSSGLYREIDRMDYGYYDPVKAFSTALMLRDWIDEKKEQDIVKKYNTTPGTLFSKLSNADWIIYSATELAKLLKKPIHDLVDLRVRMRYGIREELLDLVRLEQIGRVRARMLFSKGIKKVSEIRDNREKIVEILGTEISNKIFEQVL